MKKSELKETIKGVLNETKEIKYDELPNDIKSLLKNMKLPEKYITSIYEEDVAYVISFKIFAMTPKTMKMLSNSSFSWLVNNGNVVILHFSKR